MRQQFETIEQDALLTLPRDRFAMSHEGRMWEMRPEDAEKAISVFRDAFPEVEFSFWPGAFQDRPTHHAAEDWLHVANAFPAHQLRTHAPVLRIISPAA